MCPAPAAFRPSWYLSCWGKTRQEPHHHVSCMWARPWRASVVVPVLQRLLVTQRPGPGHRTETGHSIHVKPGSISPLQDGHLSTYTAPGADLGKHAYLGLFHHQFANLSTSSMVTVQILPQKSPHWWRPQEGTERTPQSSAASLCHILLWVKQVPPQSRIKYYPYAAVSQAPNLCPSLTAT